MQCKSSGNKQGDNREQADTVSQIYTVYHHVSCNPPSKNGNYMHVKFMQA